MVAVDLVLPVLLTMLQLIFSFAHQYSLLQHLPKRLSSLIKPLLLFVPISFGSIVYLQKKSLTFAFSAFIVQHWPVWETTQVR